jgi:hypothetical protein
MASLGSFGVIHPEITQTEPDTFDWFGSTVRVTVDVNEVELIDLLDAARAVDSADLSALTLIKDGLRTIIYPDDFNQFWELARKNRQRIEELATVLANLIESATDRPTQQPSDSSPGRLTTEANSGDGSPSPVSAGRPDLQLIRDTTDLDRSLTG